MEKTITDIIDNKAKRQFKDMTVRDKREYREMLYAGLQVTLNKYSVQEIASEIGYSESQTTLLVQKWIKLMKKGDITVNLIIAAFRKLPKYKRNGGKRGADSTNEPIVPTLVAPIKKPIPIRIERPTPKVKNVLGFIITPEDEMRERAAIRESIKFFQTFGKGQEPRMRGEYFVPGTNPAEQVVDEGKWLPLDSAAHYCGCSEEIINMAAQNGTIERRVYHCNSKRNYYEYKMDDLDRFIRDNHLL